MSAPWFSTEIAPFFSMFSLLAVLATLHAFAERGTRRTLVLSAWLGAIGVGGVLLSAAAIGTAVDQPAYVVRTLTLTGALVAAVFGVQLPDILRLYRAAELRGTIASDL
jgi:hypothetical protein